MYILKWQNKKKKKISISLEEKAYKNEGSFWFFEDKKKLISLQRHVVASLQSLERENRGWGGVIKMDVLSSLKEKPQEGAIHYGLKKDH